MPEGRAANQPPSLTTFKPPTAASLPGPRVNFAVILSPPIVAVLTASGVRFLSLFFSAGVAGASMRV